MTAETPGQAAYEAYWQYAADEFGADADDAAPVPGAWAGLPSWQQRAIEAGVRAAARQPQPAPGRKFGIALAALHEISGADDGDGADLAARARQALEDIKDVTEQPQPAPGLRADAETAELLRADLAAAEAEIAKWPRCPGGCRCRVGTDDADALECGCDGPCTTGWDTSRPAPELADATARSDRLEGQLEDVRGLLDDFTHAVIDLDDGARLVGIGRIAAAARSARKKAGLPAVPN